MGNKETGSEKKTQQMPKFEPKPMQYRHDETPVHVVKKGESLWLIALKELGSGVRYHEIMALNDLTDRDVSEGQILKLPKR